MAQCTIQNGTDGFHYTMMLIDDEGRMLDSSSGFALENNSLGPINLSSEGWTPEPGVRDLTVRLIDGRGVLTYQISKSFDIRRTDWNRPIEAQDGDELVVTMGCSFPWDIDSDSNDNEGRVILSGGAVEPSRYPDLGTSMAAAALVIGVSVALAWIIRNNREGRQLMEMAMSAAEEKMLNKDTTQTDSVEEEEIMPEAIAQEPEVEDSVPDSKPEPEDEFEARLRRLMRD